MDSGVVRVSFTFLVEYSTRASLVNMLTYKEGPIFVEEVVNNVDRTKEPIL